MEVDVDVESSRRDPDATVHAYRRFDPPSTAMTPPDVLLLDIMGTVVYDPFHREIPEHFGTDLETLVEQKDPTAWHEFERREIDESTFCERFFVGDRTVDRDALRSTLHDAYRFVDDMEPLLDELHGAVAMHAFSNYPIWYEIIEAKLGLSRYLEWSFVSWKTGYRKPDAAAYEHIVETLDVEPSRCLFVDDRSENVEAARNHGMEAVVFEGADGLRERLRQRGLSL